MSGKSLCSCNFNPRSPHGERLPRSAQKKTTPVISIHAPRTGSDFAGMLSRRSCNNFNPRSPHGERHERRKKNAGLQSDFNPRSPHGERLQLPFIAARMAISIHAPRTGSDPHRTASAISSPDFNPRSPHGERRESETSFTPAAKFQSTLPARGATGLNAFTTTMYTNFNPRSPHGERRRVQAALRDYCYFNPRSPHGERLHPFAMICRYPISIHAPRTGSDAKG